MSQINSLDDFAGLILDWHDNRMTQLASSMEVPVDVMIETTDAEGNTITLNADQRVGFSAGLLLAKSLFEKLPFSVQALPAATVTEPVTASNAVAEPMQAIATASPAVADNSSCDSSSSSSSGSDCGSC